MTKLKSYPIEFEVYNEVKDLVARVKAIDGCSVEVEIKDLQNSESWELLQDEISRCIRAMEKGLEG